MERVFVVLRSRGPAWDDSKSLEGQADWPAHAAFMDALYDRRFAALVGPLEGTRDALLVLRAASEAEIVERLAADPWTANGLLVTTRISPWQLRLGSIGQHAASTAQPCPYLSFNGACEAAFALYERCLGAKIGPIFRYRGSPVADQVPADWLDKVMHGSVTVGGQVLMGADIAPDRYETPRGFSLSLQIGSTADAERIFEELATGGRVLVPLETTFWAARFGVLVDRFGIPWTINCEAPAASSQA
jgi:PhnB protein